VTAADQQTSVSDVFDLKFVASDVVNIHFDAGFDEASQLPFIDISVEMSTSYDGSRGIEVWAGPINALKAYQVPFDPQTGLFQLRQALPAYARDGEYIINAINAIDTSGRFISLVAGELPTHITDLSATVVNPNADNIAPTLQSVALSSIAYTEQDIRITASVSVSDAGGSGIAADPAYLGMLNPSGRGFGAQIVYDDLLNGTATFVLSRFAASGTYRLQGINLTDNAGNPTQSNYAPIEFEITNPNQDIVPVTLANLKLSAFLDSVTNRPVIVKSGIASDALSGVDTVTVVLRSPSNVFYGSGEQLTLRGDGTTVDFAGQEALANNFAQGEYTVVRVDLTDKADNLSQVAGEQLVTLGFDQSIRIFGPVNPALAQTVFGSAQADYVFGSNLTNDALVAGDGNDILDGGDGNDRLFGQAGDDTLYGGRGDDELVGDESHFTPDGGADLLYGGAGYDAIFGGSGNDTLYGEEGNDFLDGQEGNDILVGGVGDDTLDGGVGNDTLYGEEGNDGLYGLLGNDTLYGGIGNDRLFGQAGADTLYGGDGDDELTGDENFFPSDAGTDSLYGGAGNDRIYGYGGNDTLTGGDGNDTLDGGDRKSVV
jgi:Ca2+-binding RTX toxin-like protein